MISIPSVGGRSHVPEECTEQDDIAADVEVRAGALPSSDRVTSEMSSQGADCPSAAPHRERPLAESESTSLRLVI